MTTKLKQKGLAEWLTLTVLILPFLFFILTEFLHLPTIANFAVDAAWACLFLFLIKNCRQLLHGDRYVRSLAVAAVIFFLSTVIGFVLARQSVLYYLWGLRNNARFFVFFFACVLFLKAEDLESYFKLFDILFVINFVVTLYQFFVLEYDQDFLGGIFGVQQGCNTYTNVFLVIVITLSVLRCMNRHEHIAVCLLKCAAALIITVLAELKMFFIEFLAIIALAVLLTKFSRRKLLMLIAACLSVFIGIQIMVKIFPLWAGWFNPAAMWETATSAVGYAGIGDMNRLTAIPMAWNSFLTTWPQKIFGLGLGNCDFAPISLLTSPFYEANSDLHHTWLSSGIMMLETGLVGLITYLAFFVVVFFAANSMERKGQGNREYCQAAKILSIMCLILFIYNNTLRIEAGYMMFFALALPFIQSKKEC